MLVMDTNFGGDRMTNDEYDAMLERVGEVFTSVASSPLFTTGVDGLWELYLNAFPVGLRQYHNCNTCRAFVERFGSLVTIDERGNKRSAIWHDVAPGTVHEAAFVALKAAVESPGAQVTGVFLSKEQRLGDHRKGHRKDAPEEEWSHLFVDLPDSAIYRSLLLTAPQAMAEKREDYKNVMRALAEFQLDVLDQAAKLLRSEALYRSEKVLGPVEWLRNLKAVCEETKDEHTRRNRVWRAVATAPAGFCHPRSSMAGTLLEDLISGNGYEWAARRFASKMHPLQYQRPQAAPSSGQIDAAEKLVEKLGIQRSLERRFARLDELNTLWRSVAEDEPRQTRGVFGHLRKVKSAQPLHVSSRDITWEKFSEKVLPEATRIEFLAPGHGSYCAFLTALHADAPPILQWDSEERRNPVSLYVYNGGSSARQWGVRPGWVQVSAISLRPSQWYGGFDHQGQGALLVLHGCVDSEESSGNALFPENLRKELHGARAVIEAFSRRAQIHGRDQASACGYLLGKNMSPVEVRVHGAAGIVAGYRIDRWD